MTRWEFKRMNSGTSQQGQYQLCTEDPRATVFSIVQMTQILKAMRVKAFDDNSHQRAPF